LRTDNQPRPSFLSDSRFLFVVATSPRSPRPPTPSSSSPSWTAPGRRSRPSATQVRPPHTCLKFSTFQSTGQKSYCGNIC
jgi:hypothetical protein